MRSCLFVIAALLFACNADVDEAGECPTFVYPCQSSLSVDFDRAIVRDYLVHAEYDGTTWVADCSAAANGATTGPHLAQLESADGDRAGEVTCRGDGLFLTDTPAVLELRILDGEGAVIGDTELTPTYESFASSCGGGSCQTGTATLEIE